MSYTQKLGLIILFGLVMWLSDCSKNKAGSQVIIHEDTITTNQPALKGRLVYHSYSCYECNDSRLYLFDFANRELKCISTYWPVVNAMNAHFSPDGKKIVFMGMPVNSTNWDIFIWPVGSVNNPVNLTAVYGSTRDEDPKFSTNGSVIVFKQNGKMKEMDTSGNILRMFDVPQSEGSMPYYTKNDSALIYSGTEPTGKTADIFVLFTADGTVKPLSALEGVEEYYPIAYNDTAFLFTRWLTASNKNDQIYLGFLNGRTSLRLPFNEPDANFSDACPVNGRNIILSSTRSESKGQYDLYLADITTGKLWSLDNYCSGINSAKSELGASYTDAR